MGVSTFNGNDNGSYHVMIYIYTHIHMGYLRLMEIDGKNSEATI